jgi:hypothetical protein
MPSSPCNRAAPRPSVPRSHEPRWCPCCPRPRAWRRPIRDVRLSIHRRAWDLLNPPRTAPWPLPTSARWVPPDERCEAFTSAGRVGCVADDDQAHERNEPGEYLVPGRPGLARPRVTARTVCQESPKSAGRGAASRQDRARPSQGLRVGRLMAWPIVKRLQRACSVPTYSKE